MQRDLMAAKDLSRHVVRALLAGLLLGLGLALMLASLRVTAVPTDLVVGACLLLGLALGVVKLPRGSAES